MMKRYSHALRVFTLVLVLGLSACGGRGCGKKAGEGQSLSLIPASSNAVAGMNWKKIQSSPLGEKIKQDVPAQYAPLLQEIESVTLGLKTQGMGGKEPDVVTVISGKFEPAKIVAAFEAETQKGGDSVVKQDYEGVTIYSSAKKPDMAMAFVDGKGLAGTPELVRQSIALSKGKGESVEKNKEIMDLISNLDRSKMLWAVATIPPGMVPPGNAEPAMALLSSLKAMDVAIDYGDNLVIDLGIITASAEDAKQFETMANSYKTLFGGSMAQKDPTLGKVLSALTIQASDKRVKIALKLDKATVQEISQKSKGASPLPPEPDLEGPSLGNSPTPVAPPAETQPIAPH